MAQFDFNIGMQLQSLGTNQDINLDEFLHPSKKHLKTRLKKLKQLLTVSLDSASEEVLADFDAWFAKAEQARELRNDYVHGRWGFSISRETGDRILNFVPLTWSFDTENKDETQQMTLGYFASQVKDAEALLTEYHRLFSKHSRTASLSMASK